MEKRRLRTTVLYELPHHLTEEDYRECLQQLPEWRRLQAESFRTLSDKYQCAKAYTLLCALLKEITAEEKAPRFGYGKYGKPFLPDYPEIHFNLSHCAKAVVCTLDNYSVGCDVEVIPDEPDSDVLDFCFSAEEKERVWCSDLPAVEFTRLWTRKEALLKMHGIGLTDELPSVLTSPLAKDVCFETQICHDADYLYTVCYCPQTVITKA